MTRLWLKMPCPHQVRAPGSPSMRVRASPKSRLAQLIRPSQPVRHRTIFLNARRFWISRRSAFGLPLRGNTTWRTPISCEVVFDRGFAVPAIGGHRFGYAPARRAMRSIGGCEHRRVGRVPCFDVVIDDHAVFVVDKLGFVTKLDGLAESAFDDRVGHQDHARTRSGSLPTV